MSYSQTYDVVVIGAGTAGLPAAIFAAKRGAKVLLIDAASRIGGTLHLSAGSLSAAGVKRARDKGIEDSPAIHFQDSMRISHGTGETHILRLWQEHAGATMDWLLGSGLSVPDTEPTFNRAHEFYSVPRTYTPTRLALGYLEIFEPMLRQEIDRGTVVLELDTRLSRLVADDTGAVRAIEAVGPDGSTITVPARSFVLTTGGYAANASLWRELHNLPKQVCAYPYSQGDGLLAARALRAKVSKAENYLPTFGAVKDIDEPETYWMGSIVIPSMRLPWEIWTDAQGRRFIAEDVISPDRRERALLRLREMNCWQIYDERIKREAPKLWLWPQQKVDRAFATDADFVTANNLSALAADMGIDPTVLSNTVTNYNAGRAVGSDEFGRAYMPMPISEPPFYAVKLYATSVVSWAGLSVDGELRVLTEDGAIIPNLYAAGEVLGMGTFGHSFLGGSTISSSITFGKLLGERLLPIG